MAEWKEELAEGCGCIMVAVALLLLGFGFVYGSRLVDALVAWVGRH